MLTNISTLIWSILLILFVNYSSASNFFCYLSLPVKDDAIIDNLDEKLCTHIIVINSIAPNNASELIINRNLSRIADRLKVLRNKNKKLKLMLSLTDERKKLNEISTSIDRTKKLGENCKKFIRSLDFNGIDIDWEFPTIHHRHNSTVFMKTFREYFPLGQFLLTFCIGSALTIVETSYEIEELCGIVDFAMLMGYDYHYYSYYDKLTGFNGPLYANSFDKLFFRTMNDDYMMKFLMDKKKCPREKLILGIPIYGRIWRLFSSEYHSLHAPAVADDGDMMYTQMCLKLKRGEFIRVWNSESKVPYSYSKRQWVSYEDELSVFYKAQWVKDNYFSGAFSFSLNCDDYGRTCSNVTFPLHRIIKKTLNI
ncbi:hypothetical protein SNEBB_002725 [Seison nebaliae]|nr:hypothetical protein SNEBB_002725 [Seison nebaliae]